MMQKRQKLFVFVGNYSTNSNMQPIYIYAVWWFKLVTNVVLYLRVYVIYHKIHQ